jgi:SAM-dependent methyltransferase
LTNPPTAAILTMEVNVTNQAVYDRNVLREEAYADDSRLGVRCRTHQLYTVDPVDFGGWTLERVPWRGDERVLDVGCGPGDLLCEMARRSAGWQALVGFDLSPGMAAKALRSGAGLPISWFVGDAQTLPFPAASFDVVMARHMLYHVPDISRAVAEAARVLRPDGYFLVATNSLHTMAEFWTLCEQAAARFPAMYPSVQLSTRFAVENAPAYLEPHFDRLQTHLLPGTLRFPTAEPFIEYFESSRALLMRPGHTAAEWQAVLDFVRGQAEAIVTREGRLDVGKVTGAIVGVKRG